MSVLQLKKDFYNNYFLILKMADKKDEEKCKNKPRRDTKIRYRRCSRCSANKKEEDMWRGICTDCADKLCSGKKTANIKNAIFTKDKKIDYKKYADKNQTMLKNKKSASPKTFSFRLK